MNKIISFTLTEIKTILRGYWLWLFLVGINFWLFIGEGQVLKLKRATGHLLISSSFILVAGLLTFLLIGALIGSREREEKINNLLEVLPYQLWQTFIGKMLALVVILLIVLLVCIIHVYIIFIIYGNFLPKFWLDSLIYIIFNWGTGLLVAGMIGFSLSIITKSKLVYPLLILTCIVISPYGDVIISHGKIFELFNTGEIDANAIFNEVRGFDLSQSFFKRRVFQICFSIFVMCVTYVISEFNRNKRFSSKSVVSIVLIISVFTMGFTGTTYASQETQRVTKFFKEVEFYKNRNIEITDPEIDVIQYNLKITINKKLFVNGSIAMKNLSNDNVDSLWFTLHHDLEINSVKWNGYPCKFNRDGDFFELIPIKTMKKGEQAVVTISYHGMPYQPSTMDLIIYTEKNGISLPGFYPWIPRPGKQSVAVFDEFSGDIVYLYKNIPSQAHYHLEVKTDQIVFSNLTNLGITNSKNSKKVILFEGKANTVSLFSGLLTTKKDGKYRLVGPPEVLEIARNFMTSLEIAVKRESEVLGPSTKIPSTIIFVPLRWSLHPNHKIIIQGEYLIVDSNLVRQSIINNGIPFEPIFSAFYWSGSDRVKDNWDNLFFENCYHLWRFRQQNNSKEVSLSFWTDVSSIGIPDYIKRNAKRIDKILHQNDSSVTALFFKNWYVALNQNHKSQKWLENLVTQIENELRRGE